MRFFRSLCPERGGASSPTVSSELHMWEHILSGVGVQYFLLRVMMDTVLWLYPVFIACSWTRAALADSVPDALRSVCGGVTMFASGAAACLWAFRRRQLLAVVRRARAMADRRDGSLLEDRVVVELEAEEADMLREAVDRLENSSRWMRFVRLNGFTYIKVGSALATLEQFSAVPAIPPCFHVAQSAPASLRILSILAESIKWSCGATIFFSMWLLILTLLMFMETQYTLLTARIRTARGYRQVRECVEWTKEVLQLEKDVKSIFFSGLMHMLVGALMVPLINTYQLIFGPRTLFSVLTLSSLPLVFGSVSLLGDRLSLGCDKVRFAAYSGPWTEEEPRARRLRALLMQSCGRTAPFAVRALGGFTRAAAYHVLKTWYQYLNMLISTVA